MLLSLLDPLSFFLLLLSSFVAVIVVDAVVDHGTTVFRSCWPRCDVHAPRVGAQPVSSAIYTISRIVTESVPNDAMVMCRSAMDEYGQKFKLPESIVEFNKDNNVDLTVEDIMKIRDFRVTSSAKLLALCQLDTTLDSIPASKKIDHLLSGVDQHITDRSSFVTVWSALTSADSPHLSALEQKVYEINRDMAAQAKKKGAQSSSTATAAEGDSDGDDAADDELPDVCAVKVADILNYENGDVDYTIPSTEPWFVQMFMLLLLLLLLLLLVVVVSPSSSSSSL